MSNIAPDTFGVILSYLKLKQAIRCKRICTAANIAVNIDFIKNSIINQYIDKQSVIITVLNMPSQEINKTVKWLARSHSMEADKIEQFINGNLFVSVGSLVNITENKISVKFNTKDSDKYVLDILGNMTSLGRQDYIMEHDLYLVCSKNIIDMNGKKINGFMPGMLSMLGGIYDINKRIFYDKKTSFNDCHIITDELIYSYINRISITMDITTNTAVSITTDLKQIENDHTLINSNYMLIAFHDGILQVGNMTCKRTMTSGETHPQHKI